MYKKKCPLGLDVNSILYMSHVFKTKAKRHVLSVYISLYHVTFDNTTSWWVFFTESEMLILSEKLISFTVFMFGVRFIVYTKVLFSLFIQNVGWNKSVHDDDRLDLDALTNVWFFVILVEQRSSPADKISL
jgi:hypothetical protein